MFLLLLHPLDSWKVAMIFVSNIIHRVTFLFSLLFSFYWACQKFSSSCWRIIALSRCQIKLAKCLNTACAHSISRSPGWLRRADLRVWVRARARTHWYQRAMTTPHPPPAPIQHMLSNGLTPHHWPHPVIHAAQSGQSVHSKGSCHWWCFELQPNFSFKIRKNESNDLKSSGTRWYMDSF